MNIFVTGGAGYVGSHCVRTLVTSGHRVTVYDNLSSGHRQAVAPEANLIVGDVCDRKRLNAVFASTKFDAVMHFAAFLNVGESVEKPLAYYRNNVADTLALLEAMRDHGIGRLVFSSSCAVFGVPEKLPISEDLPKHPINPYGATKLVVEWMLRDSAAAWGLGAVALRYFNAAGAASDGSIGEDHAPETHLIPLVLQAALGQRAEIAVFGTDYPTPDGSCVRDYVHVEDLADVHFLAIESVEPGKFEAYNVGTGKGYSVLQVIDAARRITGRTIPAKISGRRPGDPPALYAFPEKLKRKFSWEPRFGEIDEIVASAWRWHESHPRGYSNRSG